MTAEVIVGKSSMLDVSGAGSFGFRPFVLPLVFSQGAPRTTKPCEFPFVVF